MVLYTDPHSGFLATNSKATNTTAPVPSKGKAATVASVEKPQIIVKTPGPFTYDLLSDFALFEAPAEQSRLFPDTLRVTRFALPQSRPDLSDVLDCDRLELQFRRKKPAESKGPPGGDDHSVDLEIQTAHATGKQVVLYSDAELLHVLDANDFFY